MRTDGRWEVSDTAGVVRRVRSLRSSDDPFDVAVPGETAVADDDRLGRYREHEDAGATWWVEAVHPWRYGWTEGSAWPLDPMLERIEAGP